MLLKSNAIFTLLLLPSFDHRFPKLFPQCKSKRHSNGISYLPDLLKSSQQLVLTVYFQFTKKTYVLHDFRRICIDRLKNIRIRKSLCSCAFPYGNNTLLLISQVQLKGGIKGLIKTRTQGCSGQEDLSPGATCVTAHLKCLSPSIRPKYAEQSAD